MALNVNRVVNVQVSLSPMAAQQRGFGTLMLLGDSAVLDNDELYRSYTDLQGVTEDFGADAPETLAATAYFSQSPQPTSLMIARWRNGAVPGELIGGDLSGVEFAPAQVSDGAMTVLVNGTPQQLTGLDTTGCNTWQDIVTLLQGKISGATVSYANSRIYIESDTAGAGSSIVVESGSGGTDLAAILKLRAEDGANPMPGLAQAYSMTEAVSDLLELCGRDFYGLVIAANASVSDNDYIEVAQLIEASADSHIFGVTLTDPTYLEAGSSDGAVVGDAEVGEDVVGDTGDLPTKLMNGQLTRTITFWAPYVDGDSAYRLNPYFAASAMGRMFTVDFDGSRTTLTLKFKQAPSMQPYDFTATEADRLEAKNVNIYAMYANDTIIIEQGVMASGMHADERHGLDWLQDAVQTGIFNVLYQSKTKIPQTDDGMAMIVAAIEQALQQGVTNGLIAPGVWNSDGFGALEYGDTLEQGYYVYAASVNDQAQSQREAREAPAIQCAIKLAGAIESVDVTINVNR